MPEASSPLRSLREALASGEVTPRAAAEQALACANRNAGKNVYIALNREGVLRDAEELPERFRNGAKPPLYGVPVSLKDCFDLAGFVTTCGSRFYATRNAAARDDSAVAASLWASFLVSPCGTTSWEHGAR